MLHMILFVFLFIHFKSTPDRPAVTQASENIIQAVAVSQPQPTPTSQSVSQPIQQPEPLPKPEKATVEPVEQKEVVKEKPQQKVVIDQKNLVDQEIQKELTEQKKQTKVKQQLAAKKAAEQVAKELLQKELANATAAAETATPAPAAEAAAAQDQGEVDKYKALIIQAISQQWIMPEDLKKGLEAKLVVRVAPGGMVIDVKVVQSSGDPVLDRSAQTAIYKASPLPVPQDNAVFDKFRTINLTVRPEGIIASG